MNHESFFQRVPLSTRQRTKAIREDTGTETNYAELTWSNRQILCDSLQNNLDAETRKFVSELEQRHIPGAARHIERAETDSKWRDKYLNTLHLLYTLSVRAGDLNQIEKDRLISKIHHEAGVLGIDLEGVDKEHFEVSKRPELPTLTYAVKDIETGKIIRNLSREDLLQGEYGDEKNFPLFEWKVEDAGSGYDATKSVLYLPTKKGERFSRGIFGEGLKVNQAAIARTPGVNLRIHSQFDKEDGSPVAWVRHVYPEDNIVMQKGREVGQRIGDRTGSGTTIRFVDIQDQNRELRETLDPRTTRVGDVAAEFGEHTFSYPLGITEDGFVQPGVALDGDPSAQYLQGLRIGESGGSLLFSYDFQNREIIAGRDRNYLQPRVMRDTVKGFWGEVRDPSLYRVYLERVVFSDSDSYSPEREAFFDACKRLHDGQGTDRDEILLQEFITALDLRSDVLNYIATRGDGRVDLIDESKTNIVQLNISCNKDEATLLRELVVSHCTDYFFVTPREIVPERVLSDENTEQLEVEFTENEQKFVDELGEMFAKITDELEKIDDVIRESYVIYNPAFFKTIKFLRKPHQSKLTFNVEMQSNVRHITCYLPSDGKDTRSVPNLSDPPTRQEFEAKLFELHLSALMLGQGSMYSENRVYNERAQITAQALLDKLSRPFDTGGALERTLEPLYRKALVLQEEQLRSKEQKKEVEALAAELQSYRLEGYTLRCSSERIREIMQWCREHSDVNGALPLRRALAQRVVVDGGTATYVLPTADGEEITQVALTEQNKVGEWNGYSEYQLYDECYVIPVETHDRAVFKKSNNNLVAICDGLSVHIDTDEREVQSGEGVIWWESIRLDNGCIVSYDPLSSKGGVYSFHPVPQERDQNDAAVETGVVKSPVTLEYISEHWSDPVRIFQDLGQNHMDAGDFEERFLVMENGEKVWVPRDELGHSEILGYELSDKGLGYSPSGIHTMGHTQKRNPFLTGKNGEGLKLAAASAKKQGFEILFASFGRNRDGAEVSWQAEAKTIPEEYTHIGKTGVAQRLIFDVKEQERSVLEERSAITRVTLPDHADEACSERWSAWMDCVDPRNTDEFGNGGIDRYLLTTETSFGESATVGPTTALFDRPGEIFENGTLIRADQQAERSYTLGWNFPSITSTRERTHIDEDMAQAYINHFFENTTDERAVEHLLKSIQPHEIYEEDMQYAKDERFSRIIDMADQNLSELDVKPDWALPDSFKYPSLSLFRKKAQELYPGKILFSYELAKEKEISMGGSMRHIRPEERLNVSSSDYRVLRHIFPNMIDYMESVKESIIDIEPNTLEPLRTIVGEEITRVEAALDRLGSNPKTAPVLDYILKKSNTTREQVSERLDKLKPENAASTPADVFLMSEDSMCDGLASTGIGLRVSLLGNLWGEGAGRMYGVIDHELVHKMLDARDYTTEFVLLLGLLARDKLQQHELHQTT